MGKIRIEGLGMVEIAGDTPTPDEERAIIEAIGGMPQEAPGSLAGEQGGEDVAEMTIEAVLPDGTILEFPYGTQDAVIDRVVRSHLGLGTPGSAVEEQGGGGAMISVSVGMGLAEHGMGWAIALVVTLVLAALVCGIAVSRRRRLTGFQGTTSKGPKILKDLKIFLAQSAACAVIAIAVLLLIVMAAITIMVLVESGMGWVVGLAFMLGLVMLIRKASSWPRAIRRHFDASDN